jgi:hypothetical protein
MDSGITCRAPSALPRTKRRPRQATRELLEYLITHGTEADLDAADPAWFRAPPPDEGAFEWYSQFGDASKVMWGRAELLRMVIELRRSSTAPAALALNAGAWFEECARLRGSRPRRSCSDRCLVQRANLPLYGKRLRWKRRRSTSDLVSCG